ncbi:MAG TPA: ATP synthase subunit C family protein [Alphaproteobacteria bacterium]|nr:ATP synthase subunit C family protein [Alphaproteobacteria bacterium]
MENNALKLLGAGVAMIGSLGAGIGLGLIFSAWISAIARNPSAESKFSKIGFIGFAVTELVLLMCFVISIMIMKG